MSQLATKAGDEWLASDGRILASLISKPVDGGMELSLAMPTGEPVVAIVEKMNIAAANGFCALVRETYNERQASKEAASHDRHEQLIREADAPTKEESTPVLQEVVGLDYMDIEAVAARVAKLSDDARRARSDASRWEAEVLTLMRIVEVLHDASEDAAEELRSVPSDETVGETQRVGEESRTQEVREDGPSETSEASEEINDE